MFSFGLIQVALQHASVYLSCIFKYNQIGSATTLIDHVFVKVILYPFNSRLVCVMSISHNMHRESLMFETELPGDIV